MNFDVRKLSPHALDASPGDLLTVVQLQALQAPAVLQVLQGHVGDEQAVVQLQDTQPLMAAGAVAQVQDPIVGDELTVGQTLNREKSSRACSLGQWMESWTSVLSVIRMHSSRSIFSRSWQFRANSVKPESVKWEQRAASRI